MHSKFKVNILPTKGHTLPKIRPMLTSAGIDAKLYTLKNLERGNGIYALVSDISVTRQILASLEASLAPAAGYYYLVDSPRLSTIVVKGVHLKTKEGEPIPMSSIVSTIHTTNSTSGVVAASRLRNKNQQPTNALKVTFLGEAPTKASQLGLQGRSLQLRPSYLGQQNAGSVMASTSHLNARLNSLNVQSAVGAMKRAHVPLLPRNAQTAVAHIVLIGRVVPPLRHKRLLIM